MQKKVTVVRCGGPGLMFLFLPFHMYMYQNRYGPRYFWGLYLLLGSATKRNSFHFLGHKLYVFEAILVFSLEKLRPYLNMPQYSIFFLVNGVLIFLLGSLDSSTRTSHKNMQSAAKIRRLVCLMNFGHRIRFSGNPSNWTKTPGTRAVLIVCSIIVSDFLENPPTWTWSWTKLPQPRRVVRRCEITKKGIVIKILTAFWLRKSQIPYKI